MNHAASCFKWLLLGSEFGNEKVSIILAAYPQISDTPVT